jgi:hypothetical protein
MEFQIENILRMKLDESYLKWYIKDFIDLKLFVFHVELHIQN